MLARIARSSYRHRRWVLLGWIVLVVGLTVVASSVGSSWSQTFRLSGTDSQAATDLLQRRFPSQAGGTADIVFEADAGVTDPAVKQRLEQLFGQVATLPQVAEVVSPYDAAGSRQVSADGKIGYATVNFDVENRNIDESTKSDLESMVHHANGPGLRVEGGGDVFRVRGNLGATEALGFLAAIVILLIAFGSVLAMGLPILIALFGLAAGFAVVELLSNATSVPQFATQLAAMIGIGVGIDYTPVHRHPLPARPEGWPRSGDGRRRGARHCRPRRGLRRFDGCDLAPRDAVDRHRVRRWPGRRRGGRGCGHHGGVGHAAPRRARLRRPDHRPVEAPRCRQRA